MKEERLITRDDGSQIKIVAEVGHGAGLHRSIGSYVLRRESENSKWAVCSDIRPDISKMTPTQVRKNSHSEKYTYASVSEVLSVCAALERRYNAAWEKEIEETKRRGEASEMSP